jgi:hypothetical protein
VGSCRTTFSTTSTTYDGRGICYMEFGYMEFGEDMIAKVDVTFLSGSRTVLIRRLRGPGY